mmetsp:Transcript_38287/g.114651  ORF Transcript_38287/g.114651 Transcript_38287/m.114651 type:complete len:233 (+) Transcript_38287:75-773(+)
MAHHHLHLVPTCRLIVHEGFHLLHLVKPILRTRCEETTYARHRGGAGGVAAARHGQRRRRRRRRGHVAQVQRIVETFRQRDRGEIVVVVVVVALVLLPILHRDVRGGIAVQLLGDEPGDGVPYHRALVRHGPHAGTVDPNPPNDDVAVVRVLGLLRGVRWRRRRRRRRKMPRRRRRKSGRRRPRESPCSPPSPTGGRSRCQVCVWKERKIFGKDMRKRMEDMRRGDGGDPVR